MRISCPPRVRVWDSSDVGQTAFALVAANVLFFFGLGIYVRVKQGWAMAWAAASGAAVVVPAGWKVLDPEMSDHWIAAGPAALAVAALALAVLHFWQSLERPDRRGTGMLFLIQAGLAAGAAVAVGSLNWPLRF
jgi:hypothetical protein